MLVKFSRGRVSSGYQTRSLSAQLCGTLWFNMFHVNICLDLAMRGNQY